ncbi:hypothetical protein BDN72DRAFT_862744 [Pluteus cervinus]|uniref:Uncharacterized protein n=1 Tax=Pluteus cervinus TaxID=181527 RepID=A0ACD3AAB6_9AGAR|nr:hypothetical protein BDN72DRAFT_862744 [Pluteus cervinus]
MYQYPGEGVPMYSSYRVPGHSGFGNGDGGCGGDPGGGVEYSDTLERRRSTKRKYKTQGEVKIRTIGNVAAKGRSSRLVELGKQQIEPSGGRETDEGRVGGVLGRISPRGGGEKGGRTTDKEGQKCSCVLERGRRKGDKLEGKGERMDGEVVLWCSRVDGVMWGKVV